MNCPSRNDDITLEHPTWNQNPPFLAPELTTCEDLNGTVNARVQRNGDTGDGNPASSLGEKDFLTHPRLVPDRPGPDSSGRWTLDAHPRIKGAVGGEGQPRSYPMILSQTPSRSSGGVWGWIAWTASVLVCSTLLSYVRTPGFLSSLFNAAPVASDQCSAPLVARDVVVPAARLSKRSTCGGGGANVDEYDVPLHVGALFIMLAVSFFSCAFALIAKKLPFLRIPAGFFFAVRHFGTGVLIATAFVHLLPTAFILLGDDCLSSFWVDDYDAMPGAIALAAVFFVAVIEMVFQPARHMVNAEPPQPRVQEMAETGMQSDGSETDDNPAEDDAGRRRSTMDMGHGASNSNSLGRTLSRIGRDPDITRAEAQQNASAVLSKRPDEETVVPASYHCGTGGNFGYTLTPAQKHQKDILQCMMLEVGILFHSIFIGMTLSVSTGSNFVVLLIAIAFHQTFEGLALGSRIAAISWHEGAMQPWLMALAYGCTTPIGQAIGIATHSLYDPDSEFGLVLVGTMNAISSGLLVFASLVELLAEDFLSDESWRILRGKKRVIACFLVFAGAFGMSVVGAWA